MTCKVTIWKQAFYRGKSGKNCQDNWSH